MVYMRICALVLCLGFAGLLPAMAADVTTVETIIAKVNGDIITRADLERAKKDAAIALKGRGATPEQIAEALKAGEKDLLRDKIDNLLLVQRAKELNINVDAEVTKYLAGLQSETKLADPDKFQAYVREATGMTYEDFKAETTNNMLTQRVVGQEVYSKVNIPKADIEDYYNKNKATFIRKEKVFLREILVSTEGKDEAGKAAAEKKAKDLVVRARKGERFPDLVRDNSDALSAKQGGDLGGWEKADLSAEFVSALWDKPKGYITDPIRVAAGWDIVRVEEHYKEGQATLEDVEPEIKERIAAERMTPKVREYLTELRRNAFLELRDDVVDTGAAKGQITSWNNAAVLRAQEVTALEVANQARTRRLLWAFPIPGSSIVGKGTSSSK